MGRAAQNPSSTGMGLKAVVRNGLLLAMLAVLFVGCSEPNPRMKLTAALDTTETHEEKLEATSRFIEELILSEYNAIQDFEWEHHVPQAIRQVTSELTQAGFEAAQEGQKYRIPSMIYAHANHRLTMWIEPKLNKLRIVVASCDESASRQLIASHLILARRDEPGHRGRPIDVVHRSRTDSTIPDDWVPCSNTARR